MLAWVGALDSAVSVNTRQPWPVGERRRCGGMVEGLRRVSKDLSEGDGARARVCWFDDGWSLVGGFFIGIVTSADRDG